MLFTNLTRQKCIFFGGMDGQTNSMAGIPPGAKHGAVVEALAFEQNSYLLLPLGEVYISILNFDKNGCLQCVASY
jgi:hypothetical protein